MEFDEIKFQDEIELMNIEWQTRKTQMNENQTFGFNSEDLYNTAQEKFEKINT